jgi:C4-type Zn-finger protein
MENMNEEKTSECPVCGGKEVTTGKTEMREEELWHEMKCEGCNSVGFEWDASWQPVTLQD